MSKTEERRAKIDKAREDKIRELCIPCNQQPAFRMGYLAGVIMGLDISLDVSNG